MPDSTETVLITGASSGIGLELARLFAQDGSNLILVARSRERLEALSDELNRRHGVRAQVLACDLARPEAAEEIATQLAGAGITVDVLVNNAGFGLAGKFSELALDRQMDMLQVNLATLTRLARQFLPRMVERGRGGVLNVGSTAGFQPGPNMAVYFATKAYVLSLSEALYEEVATAGVTVTCLAPGAVATNFAAAADMQGSRLFRQNVLSASYAARAGHRAFRRGRALVVPGVWNKLLVLAARLAPRSIVRKIAGQLPLNR